MVQIAWCVPGEINRPVVAYEVQRATRGLDVYLEDACTIEDLHYDKVGITETEHLDEVMQLIESKSEQLYELQQESVGSPRSVKKAMKEVIQPLDDEISALHHDLTGSLSVCDEKFQMFFGHPVIFRVRGKDQEGNHGPWTAEMVQLSEPKAEDEPEPEPKEVELVVEYQAP